MFDKRYLILFSALLIFSSCSLVNNTHEMAHLVGEWEVHKIQGGFMGETLTPDSARFVPHTIRFNPDMTYVYITPGSSTIETGRYSIKKKHQDFMISLDPGAKVFKIDQIVSFQNSDKMQLMDYCADCYTKFYHRK